MKNRGYGSNGKLDRLQIQVDRSLFFHGFSHSAFIIVSYSRPEEVRQHESRNLNSRVYRTRSNIDIPVPDSA
ncbi:hypothetical protein ACFOGG_08790 [Brenneria rubrifaciens]|uniref:hypothetical protein n=1 Tax=Brenneria rubrifaciens TaxID=55213 RepID=UPI0036133337